MSDKIVMFGAGATGRGHVGLLAWQAGFEMVFVDRDPELVAALRQAGKYEVRLIALDGHQTELTVEGFRVYRNLEREAIAREVADAALVLTAVIADNLADVAETVAEAVKLARTQGRREPLNFVACENMVNSSSVLGGFVREKLSGEDLEYCDKYIGFPDCMISRVVPIPAPDPLKIVTEDYNEWTVRRDEFKGEKPAKLTVMELVDNQDARLDRKLMIHNGGHATAAYFGYHRGHQFVHEACGDPFVLDMVVGALNELGEVVRLKHNFDHENIDEYKADLGPRGAIAEMKDSIARVVRNPIRKLKPNDRLVMPANLAGEYGVPRGFIVKAIVAALRYYNPEDADSARVHELIEREGLAKTLKIISEIEPGSALSNEIIAAWDAWDSIPELAKATARA